MEISSPSRISNRYQLVSKLGQGGMGSVYRAYDRLTRETVALKQVSVPAASLQFETTSTDPTVSLALEFRTLAGLRHPHIVAVLDYGFDAQHYPYYTMQLLEGAQPITEFAQGQDTPTRIRLVIEMLQALVYLHRRGVIHRDLKPANVLVTHAGSVQVMDFGLALQHEASVQLGAGLVGTLAYMAPELFSEVPATTASDLFAVGVMLYEMTTGKHPFAFGSTAALITNILTKPPDFAPVPAAFVPLLERLLTKDPETRYASAEEVIRVLCAATGTAPPAETLSLRESYLQASAFVGRQAEFGMLREALDALLGGKGSFWLVGGESGVGKSRLLDELRTRALVSGALVQRGQAVADGGLRYHLWREVARRLILDTPLSDLEAGILKVVVPDIAVLLEREVPAVPDLPGTAGDERLALTLVDVLKRQSRPVVLLLEDLHWVEESLTLLRLIVAARDQLPGLMVVGSYRHDERPGLPEELDGMRVLKLPRLSDEAIMRLAESMLGEKGAQSAVVDLLKRETEGNVLFMIETVRVLAEEAGGLASISHVTLPSAIFAGGVQSMIKRRLSRLPEMWRPLLNRAAVAGREIDLRLLQALAGAARETDVEQFLRAGADTSIFEVTEGVWRFAHDKLREGALASLTADERRGIHSEVAAAIEASYPDDPTYAEILMEHWRAAENQERELHYLIPVVTQKVDAYAQYSQGDQLAARGLSLLPPDDTRVPKLLNLRSRISNFQGDLEEALRWAEQALATAKRLSLPAETASSLEHLASSLIDRRELEKALDYVQEALGISRALDNQYGVLKALNLLGHIAYLQDAFERARTHFQEMVALCGTLNDQRSLGRALNNLAVISEYLGAYDAARDYLEQSLAIKRELGDKRGIAASLGNLGGLTYTQGDFEAALVYHRQSLEQERAIGNKLGIVQTLANIGLIQFEHALPEFLASLQEGIRLSLETGAPQTMLAMLALAARHALREGDAEFATRAYALIDAHPAVNAEFRREDLAYLKRELGAVMTAEALAAAAATGAGADLEHALQTYGERLGPP